MIQLPRPTAPDGKQRRYLLHLLCGLCVQPALACFGSPRATGKTDVTRARSTLLRELLSDVESAVIIGKAGLAEYGPVPATEWAVEICGIIDGEAFTNSRERKNQTEKRIRQDFTLGRTITIDGWVLSRTEAALCILAATTL